MDHRLLISAYTYLAKEQLADLRPRGGAHAMARPSGERGLPPLPESWFVDVTHRVRADLGGVRIPGHVLPAVRTISAESAREIFVFIVHANIEAMSRLGG